jgi:hypothetical protein
VWHVIMQLFAPHANIEDDASLNTLENHLVISGIHNRTLGPRLVANHMILAAVMVLRTRDALQRMQRQVQLHPWN